MKHKISALKIVLLLIAFVSVSMTLAYLVARTQPVVNTFIVGEIDISLTESTGTEYDMVPGVAWKKDPTVTVKEGSEACWLFVKIEESDKFSAYMHYEVDEVWSPLGEETGVYYRQLGETLSDVTLKVLKNNEIHVRDTVLEADLANIKNKPTLTFTAYAIQLEGNEHVHNAWHTIRAEEE